MNRFHVYAVALTSLALSNGCAEATEPDGGPQEANFTSTCSEQAQKAGRVYWDQAYDLAAKLPAEGISEPAKLEPIASLLTQARTQCRDYERMLYDLSLNNGLIARLRSSGAALALANRGAYTDCDTRQEKLINLVYATTSTNPSYQKVLRESAWTAPLRSMLAGKLVLAELNGTVDPRVHDAGVDVNQAFGDLTSAYFYAGTDATSPITDVRLGANRTFTLTRARTGATGDEEFVNGTWTSTARGALTLSSTAFNGVATLKRTPGSQFAPTYSLQIGDAMTTSFRSGGCTR